MTVDFPGAAATECDAINASGTISGIYFTTSRGVFGFLRFPSDRFTSYSAPGSLRGSGPTDRAINAAGAITGYYSDTTGTHDYLRVA
jgi:hypothetical protein